MRSSPGEVPAVSVVHEHPIKRFIGWAERGCDFLGFVRQRLPEIDERTFESSLALLIKDGAVRDSQSVLSAVQRRQVKSWAQQSSIVSAKVNV